MSGENRADGELNPKYPGGTALQRERLEAEGHRIVARGRRNIRYYVENWQEALAGFTDDPDSRDCALRGETEPMELIRQRILDTLEGVRAHSRDQIARLTDRAALTDYAALVRDEDGREVWSDALQRAIDEHQVVVIPARAEPYWIDRQIVVGSDRRIEAEGATIVQTPGCDVLMLRNASTADGARAPIRSGARDRNISIFGGRWEESRRTRVGSGASGKYDAARSFFGVQTMFFFNNMEGLTLENVTFAHAGSFAVQIGDVRDAIFEKIRFVECYADGLHINGNTTNLLCRDVRGQVGDDLVALNAYDWQESSVDFGPICTVLCDGLELSPDSGYKALRIEPGRYCYDDGSEVDCAIRDAIIRDVRGIKTFKLYYQTPCYRIGDAPERGGVGSADNLFFEDIRVDLDEPVDLFSEYLESDPVRGAFAAFEIGANVGSLALRNIDLWLDGGKFPMACLVAAGPKSIVQGDSEVFDPYVSCEVGRLFVQNLRINGEAAGPADQRIFREIRFDDVDRDGHSTGRGTFGEVLLDGRKIR